RVIDAVRALEARGYPSDGSLEIALDGTPTILRLDVERRRAVVSKYKRRSEHHTLQMNRRTLAAIAYGALPPSDAARIGWLRTEDPSCLIDADRLLRLRPYFSTDPF